MINRTLPPNSTNAWVGRQLRLRRTSMGFSQAMLSKMVGITFQQVQKYENGTNSMNVERLLQFSRLLGVPISYFFEEIELCESTEQNRLQANPHHVSEREKLEIIRSYSQIPSKTTRKRIADLIHALRKEDR